MLIVAAKAMRHATCSCLLQLAIGAGGMACACADKALDGVHNSLTKAFVHSIQLSQLRHMHCFHHQAVVGSRYLDVTRQIAR